MSAGPRRPPDDDEATTEIYDSPRRNKPATRRGYERAATGDPSTPAPAAPWEVARPAQPLRVISRKSAPGVDTDKIARTVPEAKIRSLAEVRVAPPAARMGNLAPPRDPREARSRRVRDNVIWGSVTVVVASIVMLLVWFLAR